MAALPVDVEGLRQQTPKGTEKPPKLEEATDKDTDTWKVKGILFTMVRSADSVRISVLSLKSTCKCEMTFSHKQLVGAGFNAQQSIADITRCILEAFSGTVDGLNTALEWVSPAEGSELQCDTPVSREVCAALQKCTAEKDARGLLVTISERTLRCEFTYRLFLPKIESDEIEVLSCRLAQMRKQSSVLKSQVKAQKRGLKTKTREIKAKTRELRAKTLELKSMSSSEITLNVVLKKVEAGIKIVASSMQPAMAHVTYAELSSADCKRGVATNHWCCGKPSVKLLLPVPMHVSKVTIASLTADGWGVDYLRGCVLKVTGPKCDCTVATISGDAASGKLQTVEIGKVISKLTIAGTQNNIAIGHLKFFLD